MAAFDIERIDEVIHGRVRLGIMMYLANAETADFNELKAALNTTQGNLSVHLSKLEQAGFVEIVKSFLGKRPNTRIRIARAGRKALDAYLQVLSDIIAQQAPHASRK